MYYVLRHGHHIPIEIDRHNVRIRRADPMKSASGRRDQISCCGRIYLRLVFQRSAIRKAISLPFG